MKSVTHVPGQSVTYVVLTLGMPPYDEAETVVAKMRKNGIIDGN